MQAKNKQAKTQVVAAKPQVAPVAQPATLLLAAPVAPVHTVAQPATLRTARMLRITNALYANRTAAKQAQHASVTAASNMAAYNAAVAALQALHGITAPVQLASTQQAAAHQRTLNGSATNIATKYAPSYTPGSCNQVHELAAQYGFNRAATLAACAEAGINPHTAATQYNKARLNNLAALKLLAATQA